MKSLNNRDVFKQNVSKKINYILNQIDKQS